MPPKRTKGGGKKGTAVPEPGASVLHMNNRPIEAVAPKTDVAKETQKLDTQVAKCKLGVAWVDLTKIAKRLKFGVYNDRPENDAETNKLVGCFQVNGIVSMKDVAAIPLILNSSRVTNIDLLKKNFDEPEEVVELELEDVDPIVVASGQHRLAALKKYKQSLLDEYSSFEKKREKINALKQVTQDHISTYNECHEEMGRIKGLLEDVGKWGVILYDEEKLLAKGTGLANHLSRNSTLHEYKETEEEVFITILKMLKSVHDSSPVNTRGELAVEHLKEVRQNHEKNARLHKVLHHDTMCTFLATRLLPLGPHFRHRREFSVNWLAKSIDVCMGLYLSWVQMRVNALRRLSSKAAFPSYAEMRTLLDEDEAKEPEAMKKVAALRETILKSVRPNDEVDLSVWSNVLGAIDKKASASFSGVSEHLGEMSGTYITPLSSYRQDIMKTLRDAWGLTANEDFEENEILTHYDRIVARVLLYLTPEQGKDQAPIPLLGGFVMNAAWDSFVKIQDGIAEVCRWFESLLDYYRVLHPRTHAMDDWSTVMLNNIQNEARFVDGGAQFTSKVTKIIWNHRRTLMVRLNNLMLSNKQRLSPRVKDRKELASAFDLLPLNEKIASEALLKILQSKRVKGNTSRDLASEPQSIAGTLALHVTSWDWLSPTLKNTVRDIEPCVKAIAVERQYVLKYREKLLNDKLVGALRRMMEEMFDPNVKKIATMSKAGELQSTQAWKWWDGITSKATLEKPSDVLESIKSKSFVKQHKMHERLSLEQIDREAINKMIAYISNMACAQASTDANSVLSSDVVGPLQDFITGLELNAARLRIRKLNKKPSMLVDLDAIDFDLSIVVPDHVPDKFTVGYVSDGASPPATAPAPKKTSKKGKGKQRAVEEEDKQASEPESEPKADDDPPATDEDNRESEPEVEQRAPPKTKKKGGTRPLVEEVTLVPDSEVEVEEPKKKLPKATGRRVEKDDAPIPEPDDTRASSPLRAKSAGVDNTPGSNIDPPARRADSQPVNASSRPGKPKPKPRPMPRKQRQLSPRPLEDDIELVENEAVDADDIEKGAYIRSTFVHHVRCLTSRSFSDATVKEGASSGAGPVALRTPSPFHGFAITDMSWFDPEADEDTVMRDSDGVDDQGNGQDEEHDNAQDDECIDNQGDDQGKGAEMDIDLPKASEPSKSLAPLSDFDEDAHDGSVPTKPRTTSMLPPRAGVARVAAAPPVKRSRAATGASSSSSTHGRGKATKKKAKVAQCDDGEMTVIPGV
ncbi:hypothetical protein EDD22DRAFT_956780 [Suillus occidentalis]|nr:hypothetical protein EDD22DRAFT_956780 [Suillus occidentalis]